MKNSLFIFVLFLINTIAFCQISQEEYTYLKSQIPKETTTIDTQTNLLLAGEYLYYQVKAFNKDKKTFSNISKIAYVELIGAKESVIFKHKLKLVNSSAYGDFFIPASIKTGHYKLIGYTNWSKNNLSESFSEIDLYIINPYSTEKQIVSSESNNSYTEIKNSNGLQINQIVSNANPVKIDKYRFGSRQKVTLKIDNTSLEEANHYSLSVRKIDSIKIQAPLLQKQIDDTKKQTFYLPELRGEIISGQLKTGGYTKTENVTVYLSFPGENNIFKSTTTNSKGQFYFTVHEDYKDAVINLQVKENQKANFEIILDSKSFNQFSQLHFTDLKLNSNIETWLEKQSVLNQIEKAYFSVKADSILEIAPNKFFYEPMETTFFLDDFTRFKTVKETFVEVIKTAYISTKNSVYTFRVQDLVNLNYNQDLQYLEPLVLVDGIAIQNNESIINYNPYDIQSIQTITGQYVYQSELYNGVISFQTFEKNFNLADQEYDVINIEYKNRLLDKIYFQPNYENHNSDKSRIPDYRIQLLWLPNLNIKELEDINFYTSDVHGYFEVILKTTYPTGKTETSVTNFSVN